MTVLFSKRNVTAMIEDAAYLSLPNQKGKFLNYYIFAIIADPFLPDKPAYITFTAGGKIMLLNYMGKMLNVYSLEKYLSRYQTQIQRACADYVLFVNLQTEKMMTLHKSILPAEDDMVSSDESSLPVEDATLSLERLNVPAAENNESLLPVKYNLKNDLRPHFLRDHMAIQKEARQMYAAEVRLDRPNGLKISAWATGILGAVVAACDFLLRFHTNSDFVAVIHFLCMMSFPLAGIYLLMNLLIRFEIFDGEWKDYCVKYLDLYAKAKERFFSEEQNIGTDNRLLHSVVNASQEALPADISGGDPPAHPCNDADRLFAERVVYKMLADDKIAADLFLPPIDCIPKYRAVLLSADDVSLSKYEAYDLHENYTYFIHSAALCAADFFYQTFSGCNHIVLSGFVRRMEDENQVDDLLYEIEFDRDKFYRLDFREFDPVRAYDHFPHKRKLTVDFCLQPL